MVSVQDWLAVLMMQGREWYRTGQACLTSTDNRPGNTHKLSNALDQGQIIIEMAVDPPKNQSQYSDSATSSALPSIIGRESDPAISDPAPRRGNHTFRAPICFSHLGCYQRELFVFGLIFHNLECNRAVSLG
jgi:hypothetical protein